MVGRQRGGGIIKDQEGRDTFAGGDVVDGGVVRPELGFAAEDLAVSVLRLGLAGRLAVGRGQLDHRRDVEGVGVDRDAAFEHREGKPFGLQRAFVDSHVSGELGAGGVAHDHDAVRVAAEFGHMVMRPAEGLRDVGEDLVHRDGLHVAMVRRDEDVAQVGEELRLQLDAGLFAALPAAAVDPEDDRGGFGGLRRRRVDVERLAEFGRAGVGHVGLGRRERGRGVGGEQAEGGEEQGGKHRV